MRTLKLQNEFIRKLIDLPESGMGYHIVRVILKDGAILRKHKVLNSSLLVLEEGENFSNKEIKQIEREENK